MSREEVRSDDDAAMRSGGPRDEGREPRGPARSARARLVIAGAFAFFLFIVVKNAWVSEDAYISFRSIEQLFAGNGLRWNPDERVQVYTSPLWLLLLLPGRLASENLFVVTIGLSILSCIAALEIARRVIADADRFAIFVLLLSGSWAIMDFSTSGLENPLVFALIGAYLLCYFRYLALTRTDGVAAAAPRSGDEALRWVRGLFLTLGLLSITRHDVAALVLIPTVYVGVRHIRGFGIADALRGAVFLVVPLALWTVASLVYYGVPFPNTAYAKMLHGIARAELFEQGLGYLVVSFEFDLFAAAIVLLLTVRVVLRRDPALTMVWLALWLDFAYVVAVGGDFMRGRFVSVAVFWAALAAMSEYAKAAGGHPEVEPRRTMPTWAIALLLIIAMGILRTPLWLSPASGFDIGNERLLVHPHLIADERDFYFKSNSLWAYWQRDPRAPFPDHVNCRKGIEDSREGVTVSRFPGIGMYGYCAGTELRIVDPLGLSDAFLARLPVPPEVFRRAGHYTRVQPPGYRESRRLGRNVMPEGRLSSLLDDVMLQTRGPLFTRERLRALWRLNTGSYDDIGPDYFASVAEARRKAERVRRARSR